MLVVIVITTTVHELMEDLRGGVLENVWVHPQFVGTVFEESVGRGAPDDLSSLKSAQACLMTD